MHRCIIEHFFFGISFSYSFPWARPREGKKFLESLKAQYIAYISERCTVYGILDQTAGLCTWLRLYDLNSKKRAMWPEKCVIFRIHQMVRSILTVKGDDVNVNCTDECFIINFMRQASVTVWDVKQGFCFSAPNEWARLLNF